MSNIQYSSEIVEKNSYGLDRNITNAINKHGKEGWKYERTEILEEGKKVRVHFSKEN